MESEVGAEERGQDINNKFKTRDRSQNELLLAGECSRGCGSETKPIAQPITYFCHLFEGHSCKERFH